MRGGTPCAADRILATRFGIAACEAVHAGALGTLTALVDNRVAQVGLADALAEQKRVDPDMYAAAAVFFG